MTLYFDSIYGYEKITNALDPTREVFPFLSYKFLDWSQKIAPNNMSILCNHDQWQQMIDNGTTFTNTSQVHLQLRFYGPATRAGYFTTNGLSPSSFGCRFWTSGDYMYLYNELGYNNTFSSTYLYENHAYQSSLGGTRYVFSTSSMAQPRKNWVLYSDEPGDEWFAWNLQERANDYTCHGIIHKARNINTEMPQAEDFEWLISSGTSTTGMHQSIYNAPDKDINSATWQSKLDSNEPDVGDVFHGWLQDTNLGQPLISQAGYYMGHTGDRILYTGQLVPGYAYRLTDGREYLALDTTYAVRYV